MKTVSLSPFIATAALFAACTGFAHAALIIDTDGTYDGTQSTITGPTFAANDDFAVTFWFKTTETDDRDFFSLDFTGGSNLSFRLDEMTTAPNAGEWFPESDGGNVWSRFREGDYASGDIVNAADDTWHQLALVFDYDSGNSNGTAFLYFDGGLLATKGPNNYDGTPGTITMFDGGKDPFVGDFSDTAFYEGEILTSQDVSDLFNAGAGTIVIPEPSSALILISLLGLSSLLRRRRR